MSAPPTPDYYDPPQVAPLKVRPRAVLLRAALLRAARALEIAAQELTASHCTEDGRWAVFEAADLAARQEWADLSALARELRRLARTLSASNNAIRNPKSALRK